MALKPAQAQAADDGAASATSPAAGAAALPLRLDSRRLFGEAREIVIEHNARDYRLRVTAQGKLILTA